MATKSKYGKRPQTGRNLGYLAVCPDLTTRKRLLEAIHGAVNRCTNTGHKNYANYGGRGITVYPAWLRDRRTFLAYLATLPGCNDPELAIDRIDNDRGYEPGNLRFVTWSESNRNRRQKRRGGGSTLVKSGRWQAQLCADKKNYYLGLHETREQAEAAVAAKRTELGI